jgi:hypothetical protein
MLLTFNSASDLARALEGATVPVAIVTSRIEAELIVGMLRNYDVRAVVSADDAGGQDPALQNQGVRVLVAPFDEVEARQLLAAAWDTSPKASHGTSPSADEQAAPELREGISELVARGNAELGEDAVQVGLNGAR